MLLATAILVTENLLSVVTLSFPLVLPFEGAMLQYLFAIFLKAKKCVRID